MNPHDNCRLCLVKSSKNSEELFFPIDYVFEKKFKEIAQLELVRPKTEEEKSRFPNQICITCVQLFEQHYNYRNGLIQNQALLHLALGIETSAIQNDHPNENHEKNACCTKEEDESSLEQNEDQEVEELEAEHDAKEEAVSKIEAIDNRSDTYERYEQHEDASEYEDEDKNAESITSETEEIVKVFREVDQELETTIEQLEENYEFDEDEGEDYPICYVNKSEGATDDEFVVYEEDIAMEEVHPTTKRKYTKQSKDAPKQFKCWIKGCRAEFSFRATMKKHMRHHHEIECGKSTCFVCGKNYSSYADFLAHMKSHTRKSQCDICKLTFVDDDKMKTHQEKSHRNYDASLRHFHCEICSARFKRKEHLNSHIVYKHSDKSARKHQCKECPSLFLTRQDLKNHEKSHSQIKIDCIYCSYNCRDLKSIKRHCLKIHYTTKIYSCSCRETFETHREFAQHKKICQIQLIENGREMR